MGALFRKTKYVQLNTVQATSIDKKEEPNVPSGSWIKCPDCGNLIYKDDYKEQMMTCGSCGKYFRVSAPDRLKQILDQGSYRDLFQELETVNVLDFPSYEDKISGLQAKTGMKEGVLTGIGAINQIPVAIGVMDSRFMMGSMGKVVGEKVTRLIELATKENLPLILFTASGGARMQEGLFSLMQMAKTSAALKRYHEARGLYITVLTDPTSGGVTASFAMLGDIILAEPKAFIGFAGPRVIRETIRQELPEGFQQAEFLLEHGFVDAIVKRPELKETLTRLLKMHDYLPVEKNNGIIEEEREEATEEITEEEVSLETSGLIIDKAEEEAVNGEFDEGIDERMG